MIDMFSDLQVQIRNVSSRKYDESHSLKKNKFAVNSLHSAKLKSWDMRRIDWKQGKGQIGL